METTHWALLSAAAGIAVTHTLLGPDHYLPFIFLARARGWSTRRTGTITAAFGLAHVLSSVALGTLGLLFGVLAGRLEQLQQLRGSLTAGALVAFGVAYASWGLRRGFRRSRGLEPHGHDGHVHLHRNGDVPHSHDTVARETGTISFWTLFAIFVLGPCEPLIPLLALPASRGRWDWALSTVAVFGVVTVASMVVMTLVGLAGLKPLLAQRLQHWSHALAGGVIAASGLAILVLGV